VLLIEDRCPGGDADKKEGYCSEKPPLGMEQVLFMKEIHSSSRILCRETLIGEVANSILVSKENRFIV
jgi:hypothetical protein